MSTDSNPYFVSLGADPETHPWGFFGMDPWFGGAGAFHWYVSPQALLAEVRIGEAELYLHDAAAAVAELNANVDALESDIAGGTDPAEVLTRLDDACESDVLWAGTLDDLLNGTHEWAKERRADFRGGDADEDAADTSAITAAERTAFVQYIREYIVA